MSILKYLLSTLLLLSFASQQQLQANPKIDAGSIIADASGEFVPNDSPGFTIGDVTVTDPLLVGIPNQQTAFAVVIPVILDKKWHESPIIAGTYFSNIPSLIGQTLTGNKGTCTIETIEISVNKVEEIIVDHKVKDVFNVVVAAFVRVDPGFDETNLPSLITQFAAFGFGVDFTLSK